MPIWLRSWGIERKRVVFEVLQLYTGIACMTTMKDATIVMNAVAIVFAIIEKVRVHENIFYK